MESFVFMQCLGYKEKERKISGVLDGNEADTPSLLLMPSNSKKSGFSLPPIKKRKQMSNMNLMVSQLDDTDEEKSNRLQGLFENNKKKNNRKVKPAYIDIKKNNEISMKNNCDMDTFQRAGSCIEYSKEASVDLFKVVPLKLKDKAQDFESDGENEVYPLSKKYKKKDILYMFVIKLAVIVVMMAALVPVEVYYNEFSESFEYRIGYYADLITTKKLPMAGINEFKIETKN